MTLEPSCWSMLTDDAKHLVDDPRTATVAAGIETFEQALLRIGVPELLPRTGTVVVHRHCHDRAGAGPDALTQLVGCVPDLEVVDSGAGRCGMAGAFGYAHPELSRAIAADRSAPAARAADFVVAHGSSCRQQVTELAGAAGRPPGCADRDPAALGRPRATRRRARARHGPVVNTPTTLAAGEADQAPAPTLARISSAMCAGTSM